MQKPPEGGYLMFRTELALFAVDSFYQQLPSRCLGAALSAGRDFLALPVENILIATTLAFVDTR